MSELEYKQALKLGEKAYRSAVAKGEYPYLPALDDLLSPVKIVREENLGIVEIPIDQIVGTKTAGRQNAFAVNFMPLMEYGSEFATKWSNLYDFQTTEGNRDPIFVYEFLNRFYVQEGNKRVSVYKYLNSPSIEGKVIRLVPRKSDSKENKIYYEFMEFYKATKINYLIFTQLDAYKTLVKAVGKTWGEVWNQEERNEFACTFFLFKKHYTERGGDALDISPADAFLFFLSVYTYDEVIKFTDHELKTAIDQVWNEFMVQGKEPEEALVLDRIEYEENGLINKLLSLPYSGKHLKVAFVHEKVAEHSSWTYSHELGRAHLDESFSDAVTTKAYYLDQSGMTIEQLMNQVIEDGNDIIFTANQKFLAESLRTALEHPHVKILNCSINRSFSAIRTYYGRMYEAKFLCGMVAGIMADNNKILYSAYCPMFGSFADINAFALGARMVNPRSEIYVHWMADTTSDFEKIVKEHDISIVSYTDIVRLSSEDRRFGLYRIEEDGSTTNLAFPMWNWGEFYEKIIRDILEGNWNRGVGQKSKRSVNYWWGISGDIVDLFLSGNVPYDVRTLVEAMRKEIFTESFHPFQGEIISRDGVVMSKKGEVLTPEQIITMDWYVNNVVGDMPNPENLTDEAKSLMALQEGPIASVLQEAQAQR